MKQILKSLMFGFLYFLGSCLVSIFGYITVSGFCFVCTAVGWEAAWLVLASAVTGFMTLFVLFILGAIPLATINELKSKLEKLEDADD